MSEFKPGDPVIVTHENGDVIHGAVFTDGLFITTLSGGGWITDFEREGYSIALDEARLPKLPAEPGVYQIEGHIPFHLRENGSWFAGHSPLSEDELVKRFLSRGELVRLAPVPDTARKVIDGVREALEPRDHPSLDQDAESVIHNALDEVLRAFEVTS